jgi:hypothetical protein
MSSVCHPRVTGASPVPPHPQIAEGCAKVMLEQLQPLVAMCLTGLGDAHPRVSLRLAPLSISLMLVRPTA